MSTTRPRITVVGSLNMDLVLQTHHAPAPGETVLAHALAYSPGGKGANQAVACARLGGEVHLMGRLGVDAHGQTLREGLRADGIDDRGVQHDPQVPSGLATIVVDAQGQNCIVVAAGANAGFVLDGPALAARLVDADALVAQLEVPLPQVLAAARQAHQAGRPVFFNPSPVQPLPDDLWPLVDTLVVNESEAAALAEVSVRTPHDAAHAGRLLRERGPARVVVTLGAQGAVAVDADGARHHPGLQVNAVDTTAAGDTFMGGLAVALAQGAALDAAVQRGIQAASLCVTRPGAQAAIPHAAEVDASPLPPHWTAL